MIQMLLLAAAGYVANAEQTVQVQHAMTGMINLAPMALYLISLIPLLLIKMNNKKAKENAEILRKKEQEAK